MFRTLGISVVLPCKLQNGRVKVGTKVCIKWYWNCQCYNAMRLENANNQFCTLQSIPCHQIMYADSLLYIALINQSSNTECTSTNKVTYLLTNIATRPQFNVQIFVMDVLDSSTCWTSNELWIELNSKHFMWNPIHNPIFPRRTIQVRTVYHSITQTQLTKPNSHIARAVRILAKAGLAWPETAHIPVCHQRRILPSLETM